MPQPSHAKPSTADAGPERPSPQAQFAFPLSTSPDTIVNVQLTLLANTLLLFLATGTAGAPPTAASLGSFVYALPNQSDPTGQPLSTPLYTRTTSLDFVTRLSRILARKTGKPVYVGGDVKFWAPEDEAGALKNVVDIVMQQLAKAPR